MKTAKKTKLPTRLIVCAAISISAGTVAEATTILDVNFGSSNAGNGGFSFTDDSPAGISWTENPDNFAWRNENSGNEHQWLVQQISLNRSNGAAYSIQGRVTIADGYADDNNRIGLIALTDLTKVASRDNSGQVGFIWNTDDGSINGSPGNDAPDAIGLWNGYNNATLGVADVLRDQTTPYSQDLFGQTGTTSFPGQPLTYAMDLAFVGSNIEISGSLTYNGNTTLIGDGTPAVVSAADFTGDYFGFVSYARARNYDELNPDAVGNTPEGRARPWEAQFESFTVTQTAIPEPSAFALCAGGLAGLILTRRRRS